MALTTKIQRVCDVTGATRNVRHYHIRVELLSKPGDAAPGLGIFDSWVDLAPRAVGRLVNFVQRGLKPIGKGKDVAVAPTAEEPSEPPPEDLAPPTDPSDFDKEL